MLGPAHASTTPGLTGNVQVLARNVSVLTTVHTATSSTAATLGEGAVLKKLSMNGLYDSFLMT